MDVVLGFHIKTSSLKMHLDKTERKKKKRKKKGWGGGGGGKRGRQGVIT